MSTCSCPRRGMAAVAASAGANASHTANAGEAAEVAEVAKAAVPIIPHELLRGVYQVLFGCQANGHPLGLLMESTLALIATGVPVTCVHLAALNNDPIASLTVRSDEELQVFHMRVKLLMQCSTIQLYVSDPTNTILQHINDATTNITTVGELRRSASGTSDADVVVLQGKTHDMGLTSMQTEHDRGDIDCPHCKRKGPSRYTGHTACVVCRRCMFCSIDLPFCVGPTGQATEHHVHWQSRIDWETALRFAQHRSELERFYSWQQAIMKP